MFFFSAKKIHIDCFTNYGIIAEDNPIRKASHFIPEWWRTLPNSITLHDYNGVQYDSVTMKGCTGFIDLYSRGIIMPLWVDLNFKVSNSAYFYRVANLMTDNKDVPIESHHKEQHNFQFSNFAHFKIKSPWVFKEKTGVNFSLNACLWNNLQEIPKLHILSGVLNFKTQSSTHINGFASFENQPYQYNIKSGTPMVHFIPLDKRDVVPHIHILSDIEWQKMKKSSCLYKFTKWNINRKKIHIAN